MTIFVSGARGFIGRHVARSLAADGARVVGLGHGAWPQEDCARWGVAEWLNGEVSPANLDALVQRNGVPDVVYHLAGGSAVGPSYTMPAEDLRRSVLAAGDLLEWMRVHAPSTPVVMASSAAVYGAGHAGPIAETSASTPFSPYGFHKRMAELLLESYAKNFGLKVGIVRLFSVYGPQLRKQLLWDACMRLKAGANQLELGGHGKELRDWLHVEDAVTILRRMADLASATAPILNGGTGVATPVRAVALGLIEAWGGDIGLSFSGQSRAGDPQALVADVARLADVGLVPPREWRAGIAEYVAWFKQEAAR